MKDDDTLTKLIKTSNDSGKLAILAELQEFIIEQRKKLK